MSKRKHNKESIFRVADLLLYKSPNFKTCYSYNMKIATRWA